jgi:hypothetical protein
MSRYSQVPIVKPLVKSVQDQKRRYANVKYPQITLDSQDIYVYTTQGDRYDVLALTFYKDPDLWWIINRAILVKILHLYILLLGLKLEFLHHLDYLLYYHNIII